MRYAGLLLLSVLIPACGDAIEGDWQLCTNSACTDYDRDVLRLREDQTFVIVDTEKQCEAQSGSKNGTYEFDNDRLRIYPFDGRSDDVAVELSGDRAILNVQGDRLLLERTELGAMPACMNGDDSPDGAVIRKPQPGSTSPGGGGT